MFWYTLLQKYNKKYHGNKETSKSACIYVIYFFFGMLMVHLIEYLGSQTHSLIFFEHFLCVSIFMCSFFQRDLQKLRIQIMQNLRIKTMHKMAIKSMQTNKLHR